MTTTPDTLHVAIGLHQAGRLAEAEALYRQLLHANPNHPDVLQLLGALAHQLGQHGAAAELIERSLSLHPAAKQPLNNLGEALRATGQIERSIQAFERALELDPGYVKAHSNLLLTLHFSPASDGESLRKAHRLWGAGHADAIAARPHGNDRSPQRPLRIGYVSPDLRRHSVGYFIEPILEHHRRDEFRIHCYSNHRANDEVTERLRACADEWRDITRLNDDDAADLIRADQIDILIDLAGHMAKNRLLVFARKPAPVQATYLGYPNGTGMTQMDYRISDEPSEVSPEHYVERLVQLPGCAWCYRPPEMSPEVAEVDPGRPITFGSFNKFPKITPQVMEAWAEILRATPESRLLVKAKSLGDQSTRAIAQRMFEAAGISPDRLTLLGWEGSVAAHLRLYGEIDIALDCFPYNGTTTTCEALWMGVPVVALLGQTHVSRVGASLLSAVGFGELIADSTAEYVGIVTALARDAPRRTLMRKSLRDRMRSSPLMQPARFTGNLETAYRRMWRQWCET